jgi:hypothetical protein
MNANYSFHVDPARHVVRIKVGGFFGANDLVCFSQGLTRAYAGLPRAATRHLTLCDISDCKIQLQEVVDGFRRLLEDPQLMSRRIAFVTGTSPARMQIRRLVTRDTARVFDTVDVAEQWLLSETVVP